MQRILLITLTLLALLLALPGRASADYLYATDLSNSNSQIYQVDKSTGALLAKIPTAAGADTLIFNAQGDIIYSAYSVNGQGQVRIINPAVGLSSDRLIATVGNDAVDLALDPGGKSVLVTSQSTGQIVRVNLSDGSTTLLASGGYIGGVAYDSSGRLFAVRYGFGESIVQLNPTTGTVINSTASSLTGLDGLAFDPFTGSLFASSRSINGPSGREGFYEVSLQQSSFLQTSLITNSSFPTTFDPDGLEPDGQGNLYLASEALRGDNKIYVYNEGTGNLSALTVPLPGLDDLAPLIGGGAPPSVPEPSSIVLLGIGALSLLGYGRWTRCRIPQ